MSNEHIDADGSAIGDQQESSKPSDGATTKLMTSIQEEPIGTKLFTSEFNTVKNEKDMLNESTETMKIDPVTAASKALNSLD